MTKLWQLFTFIYQLYCAYCIYLIMGHNQTVLCYVKNVIQHYQDREEC